MRRKEIQALPTQTECTICLNNDSTDVGLLKCKHTFCFECIENWSEHENSCPLCKVRFSFIDRIQTNSENASSSKPVKTRVKIKKKNQIDYIHTHPGESQDEEPEDHAAIWANFIAGISATVGSGMNSSIGSSLLRYFASDGDMMSLQRNRTITASRYVSRRHNFHDDGHRRSLSRGVSFHPDTFPTNRGAGSSRNGSQSNPIELSDDEGAVRRGTSSSSSGIHPTTTLANSTSATAMDLIDLTDDVDTTTLRTLPTISSAVPQPQAQAQAPLHPTTALSNLGNYNLMDFVSDDEDEDYEPPVDLEAEEMEIDDDNSELSSEEGEEEEDERWPATNEVIELDDSAEEDNDIDNAANRTPAAPRLSGIMIWCPDCETFHDKQRVLDNADYCPATYSSLVGSAGVVADAEVEAVVAASEAPSALLVTTPELESSVTGSIGELTRAVSSTSSSSSSSASFTAAAANAVSPPTSSETPAETTHSNNNPTVLRVLSIRVRPSGSYDAECLSGSSQGSSSQGSAVCSAAAVITAASSSSSSQAATSSTFTSTSTSTSARTTQETESLVRTQSDATTASSRSCAAQSQPAAGMAMECAEPAQKKPQENASAIQAPPQPLKRSNFMVCADESEEEEEELKIKRVRRRVNSTEEDEQDMR